MIQDVIVSNHHHNYVYHKLAHFISSLLAMKD